MQPLKRSHPDSTATADRSLRHVVERLTINCTEFLSESRAPANDISQLWQAVLREVEETVLPRSFELTNKDGTLAHLTIASRRLVAVRLEGHDPGTGIPDNVTAAAHFMRQLETACKVGGPFYLKRAGGDETPSDAGASCTAEDLRGLLPDTTTASRLHEYFRHVEPSAEAWLFLDEGEAEAMQGGQDAFCDMLRELAREVRRQSAIRAGLAGKLASKPSCTLLPFGDDRCVVTASDQQALFLAIQPIQDLSASAENWNALYSPGFSR